MRAFTCPVCRHLVTFESTECLHCGTELGVRLGRARDRRGSHPLECAEPRADRAATASAGEGLCAAARSPARGPPTATPTGSSGSPRPRRPSAGCCSSCSSSGCRSTAGASARAASRSTCSPARRSRSPPATPTASSRSTSPRPTPVAPRAAPRSELDEPYRTLLGHMRHEIGHYYQPILAPEGSAALERCRALFGDERADYAQAMERHYAEGRRPTGPSATSAPTRRCTRGRTGPRRSPTTCTSATCCRPRSPTASRVSGPAVAAADAAPLYSYPGAAGGDLARAARGLAPAHLRAQRDQPQHRRRRPLPVRARARGRSTSWRFIDELVRVGQAA